MKHILLISWLLIFISLSQSLAAQRNIELGILMAADYTTTPTVPRYMGKGHGNQLVLRYGVKTAFAVTERLKIGVNIERYTRREVYDCVYFPTPDNPPQRAYYPLINDPVFGCEYETDTKIIFVEIPLVISYDFLKKDNFSLFMEFGYGYQLLSGRHTMLRNWQSDAMTEEKSRSFVVMSKQASRLGIGLVKKISSRVSFNASFMYKIDSFSFDYESVGINTGLQYEI